MRIFYETSRRVAQSGSAPVLGTGCRGFESRLSDHFFCPQVLAAGKIVLRLLFLCALTQQQ